MSTFPLKYTGLLQCSSSNSLVFFVLNFERIKESYNRVYIQVLKCQFNDRYVLLKGFMAGNL